jgi:hypothetical protein
MVSCPAVIRFSLFIALTSILAKPVAADDRPLLDLGKLDLQTTAQRDLRAKITGSPDQPVLSLKLGHKETWPGISIPAPASGWDLSASAYVVAEVKNVGADSINVGCRVDSPDTSKSSSPPAQVTTKLAPGETTTLRVRLVRKLPPSLADKFFGMNGLPTGYGAKGGIDVAHISRVLVFVGKPTSDSAVDVLSLRVTGRMPQPLPDDPTKVFPLIDAMGQYRHADWPGKIKTPADFAQRRQQEASDLAQHPGPTDWDQFGGWKAGPQLQATGFFRAEKYQGKWWLVDPEGRLFWSHGTTCVRSGSATTPITDREYWFADLPAKTSPLGRFYGKGYSAAHGYYDHKNYATFNFSGLNLFRKYGDDWNATFNQLAHRRLRSWGMNTIANWSDMDIALLHKTPYVATVGGKSRMIEGSAGNAGKMGYSGQFPDPFDPGFAQSLARSMNEQKGQSAGDPWCLGYFVHNELSWREDLSQALASLASPADQPAKQAFVDDLKAKYSTIERLNQAWGTTHASWQALLDCKTQPNKEKAHDDLQAFASRLADQYFRLCHETVKRLAPQQLYLGCRFAWSNETAIRAAAKYCDVLSFNLYRYTIADFRLPEGVDKPVVVGEFHFGALDRGMFHTGLRPTENQAARAEAYRSYVTGALTHPCFVGTHWFQFGDQATTGRNDGENYQIGFIDVCDTPYPETVQACREVGYSLYKTRLEAK